jgi:hypothetical protein
MPGMAQLDATAADNGTPPARSQNLGLAGFDVHRGDEQRRAGVSGRPRRTQNALEKVALWILLRGQWTDHVSRSNALVRVSMVKLLRSRQALFWLANSPGTRIAFSLGTSRIQRTEATYSVMSSSLSTLWW